MQAECISMRDLGFHCVSMKRWPSRLTLTIRKQRQYTQQLVYMLVHCDAGFSPIRYLY